MTFKSVLHYLNRRDNHILPKNLTLTKLFIILFIGVTTFFSIKTVIATQTATNSAEAIRQQQEAMTKGATLESWIDSSFTANLMSTKVALSGTYPENVLNGTLNTKTVYNPGGAIGIANQVVASTFTPPASGIQYLAQVKDNFLGKSAYANETGFKGLNEIMSLWKMSRNIVYILISLVFIITGIMIMLRIKISPQATVTIQSSIPKIITTLIFVTFSYAIAGLCIDLINLLQAFGIALLFNGLGKGYTENLFSLDWSKIFSLTYITTLFTPYDMSSLNATNFFKVLDLIDRLAPTAALSSLSGLVGTSIGLIGGPVGAVVGGVAGYLLVTLVINIFILISLIKFIFALTKCYIVAVLKIIFGPFEILLGAFPNTKKGVSSWLIGLFANLAVFPICLLFIIFANIFIDKVGAGLWAPNLVSGPSSWLLPIIVGISSIVILPKLPPLIVESISNAKPSPYGKALGEGFKAIPGVGLTKQVIGLGRESLVKAGGEEAAAAMGFRRGRRNPSAGTTGSTGTNAGAGGNPPVTP